MATSNTPARGNSDNNVQQLRDQREQAKNNGDPAEAARLDAEIAKAEAQNTSNE